MAAFTMKSAARRTRKNKGLMPNPFGEGAELERKYIRIREWRGEDLISLLLRTSIRLQTTFDRRFAQFGITAQGAAVLLRCVEAGETSAGKLAQAMRRDKGKITRFVDRLEASRFLTRTCNPKDHRLLIIKATRLGSRMAPRLRMIFEELREQFFDAILTQDIEQLGSVLSQLYENAGHLDVGVGLPFLKTRANRRTGRPLPAKCPTRPRLPH
jgi:DNA-binding MarR family transcriptional regulator